MEPLSTHNQAIDQQALADAARLHAVCIDCIARLSGLQAEAAWTMLAQQAQAAAPVADSLPRAGAAPRDELWYLVGEAHRVVVEAQSQLRLLLERPRDDAAAGDPRPTAGPAPRAARACLLNRSEWSAQ